MARQPLTNLWEVVAQGQVSLNLGGPVQRQDLKVDKEKSPSITVISVVGMLWVNILRTPI